MRALVLILVAVFAAVMLWRNVFDRKRDRKAIRFGLRELVIAGGLAVVVAGGLFFALTNNTWRVL